MIAFAPAKINLGLRVLGKRDDGYHNIESILIKTALSDVVEVIPSNETGLCSYGFAIPGDGRDNLCLKAFDLIKARYRIGNVYIHLQKNIAPGSGLGGASSDAVATLVLLNKLFGIGLTTEQLSECAAELGSDCPFFLHQGPALVSGTGTELRDIDVALNTNTWICILVPETAISTQWAYSKVSCSGIGGQLQDLVRNEVEAWQGSIDNSFEEVVFKAHPEIEGLKRCLIAEGAFYASLSGSGSAVYGLFDKEPPAIKVATRFRWAGRLMQE